LTQRELVEKIGSGIAREGVEEDEIAAICKGLKAVRRFHS
jgi:hypothetical protein